ncbi:hypothetical protein [Hymenobacter sp. PAMC 26628]|uniref:hypothetical protein n=1 Tax=Hymenobacter sp. PAMC 26628 TaxID=1484118 RepID=UPI00090204C0|nr:hypothetical protein [Hymenobacter sp. PAMC 26628]
MYGRLAAAVIPANQQERAQVGLLAEKVQLASGQSVTLAYTNQEYTGDTPAQEHHVGLQLVKLRQAKHGVALVPRRWETEHNLSWSASYKRMVVSL